MSARPKFTLLSLALALFFALLAASITSPIASATSAQSRKTASGHFSVSGQSPLAFSACKSGQALGKFGIATTTRVCAFSYGKEADQLSRLSYYGYRYYDPLSLQWTQADPLYRVAPDRAADQPRRMSLYTFSLNNPVRYFDPDGMDPTFNAKISRRAWNKLIGLQRRGNRVKFMKKVIEFYGINAGAHGLKAVRRGRLAGAKAHTQYDVMYANRGFFEKMGGSLNRTENVAYSVLTTLHETAHLEFVNTLLQYLPIKGQSSAAISAASEIWAYAVEGRGAEAMLEAGTISKEQKYFMDNLIKFGRDDEEASYSSADWAAGQKIYEAADKLNQKIRDTQEFLGWQKNVNGGARVGGLVSANGK